MNAAHSLGVGSCWIHRAKEVFEMEVGIPDDYEGIGNCILGYSDCKHPNEQPRKEKFTYYLD